MDSTKRLHRVVMFVASVIAATAVCSVHADVVLDLGRGPVTVHVPPGYDPSQPAPLVMALHGYSGTGQGIENWVQLIPWSDRLGFLYVFPDGTVDQDDYQFWNATDACCDFYGTGVDDSGYLRALIEAIIAELSVDTGRVYLLGYSNGGCMAYRMACDHADIIAAVASLAGFTYLDPTDCNPSAPVRTLEIHGTADATAIYEGGAFFDVPYPGAVATAEQWATYNQCSTVPDLTQPPLDLHRGLPGFETTVARYADGCAPGGSSELWTIVDGGHGLSLSRDFALLVLNFFLSEGGENALLVYRGFIPAAAYAAGAQGAFFQTDVDVTNTGDSAGRYRFLWLPRGADINNVEPMASEEFTLGARMAARSTNAVHEIFGLEPDAVGAIAIEASSMDLLFTSRTYNLDQSGSGGTYGQGVPAIAEREMIQGRERRRILFGSDDEDYRTNIGCLNADREPTRIYLELFDQQGTSLDVINLLLDRWSNEQLNRLFADFAPVLGSVETYTPISNTRYCCYGSVLDNVTSDPTTILPQVPSDDTSFIPAAALAAGAEGSFFTTDLDLTNVGSTDLTYELLWLPRGEDNSEPTRSETFSLAAGFGVRYANVLGEVFGLEPDEVGALAVEASGTDLLAMSRTYNSPSGEVAGTFGQELPGYPANQMIPTGVTKRIISLSENDDVRANVGCINGVDAEVAVAIDLYDSDGVKLETKYMMLLPYSNRQINGIFREYAPVDGYVEIRTHTPDAMIYCYGSVLDNRTSDPTTVPPQ